MLSGATTTSDPNWWQAHIPQQLTVLKYTQQQHTIKKLEKLGEGTFSNEYKVQFEPTGSIWMMRRVNIRPKYREEVTDFIEWMAAVRKLLDLGGPPAQQFERHGRFSQQRDCFNDAAPTASATENHHDDKLTEAIEWSRCDVRCAEEAFLQRVRGGVPHELQGRVGGKLSLPFAMCIRDSVHLDEVRFCFYYEMIDAIPARRRSEGQRRSYYPSIDNFGMICKESEEGDGPGGGGRAPMTWAPILVERHARPFILSLLLMVKALHELGITGCLQTGNDDELLLGTGDATSEGEGGDGGGGSDDDDDEDSSKPPILVPVLRHLRVPWREFVSNAAMMSASHQTQSPSSSSASPSDRRTGASASTTTTSATEKALLEDKKRALCDVVNVAVCVRGILDWPMARVFSSWQLAAQTADERCRGLKIESLLEIRREQVEAGVETDDVDTDISRHFAFKMVSATIRRCKEVEGWSPDDISSYVPGSISPASASASVSPPPQSATFASSTVDSTAMFAEALRSPFFGLRQAQVVLEHRLHCISVRKDRLKTMFVSRRSPEDIKILEKTKLVVGSRQVGVIDDASSHLDHRHSTDVFGALPWDICAVIGEFSVGVLTVADARWHLW